MEIVIVWIVLAALAGAIASNKGRSGWGFFFLSLLLSPLIGGIAALAAQRDDAAVATRSVAAGTHRKCPHCAELILPDAKVCRFCGHDVPPLPAAAHAADPGDD